MRGRAVWAFGSGLGMWLLCGVAHAQCTKDTDCKGDRVCEAGKCTSPLPPAPSPPPGATVAPPGAAATPPDAAATPPDAAATPPDAAPPASAPTDRPPLDQTAPVAVAPVIVPPAVSSQPAPAAAVTPLQDGPALERRSRGAMVAGIIMVSVGPIALLGALTAKNSQEECDDRLESAYPDHRLPTSERYRLEECDSYTAPVYVLGIGGAILTVGGIPLIIYGAKNVPKRTPAASVRVVPWATPEAGGLKLRLTL